MAARQYSHMYMYEALRRLVYEEKKISYTYHKETIVFNAMYINIHFSSHFLNLIYSSIFNEEEI